MESEDITLRVLMEDAGCERLDKACLENIISLIKEGKYPKLSKEELDELDKGLASLVAKLGLRDHELAQEASKVGLEKTSSSLSHGLEEEEGGPPTIEEEVERKSTKGTERRTGREVVTTPAPVIKVKSSKTPLVLSLLSILISLGTLVLILGYVKLPNVKVPTTTMLEKLDSNIKGLETRIITIEREMTSYKRLMNSKITKINLSLRELQKELSNLSTSVKSNITELKGELHRFSVELNKLDATLKLQGRAIQSLKKYLIDLNESLNSKLKTAVENLNNYINLKLREIRSSLNVVKREVMRMNVTYATKLKELESQYVTKDQLNSLRNRLVVLNRTLDELSLKLVMLNKLNTKLLLLEKEVNALKMRLKELDSLKKNINDLRSLISKYDEKLAQLKSYAYGNLRKDILSLNATLGQIKNNINTIEIKIDTINRNITTINYELSNLEHTLKSKIVRLVTSKAIIDQIANSLISKAKFDKIVAERLLNNITAFYELVKKIAQEVYLNMSLSAQGGGLVSIKG